METKKLKEVLRKSSAKFPEVLENAKSDKEELASTVAYLTMHIELLEDISNDLEDPDFEEKFYLLRKKLVEIVKLLSEKV